LRANFRDAVHAKFAEDPFPNFRWIGARKEDPGLYAPAFVLPILLQ